MVIKRWTAPAERRHLLNSVSCGLIGLAPLAAASQTVPAPLLRPGQPEVLSRPASVPALPAFDPQRFKSAYAAAGSPKVVLFWNRELTDRLVADRVELSRDSLWEQHTRSWQQAERQGERVTEKRQATESSGAREGPSEERDARMRSAYVGTLLGSGMQLLDRNLILRTQGLRDKAVSDPQQVETAALSAGASWLLEVVLTPATQRPDGWVLHSRLKRIADGALLADSLYDEVAAAQAGTPPDQRFVADPVRGDYKKVQTPEASGADDRRLAAGAALSTLRAWMGISGPRAIQ